MNVLRIQTVVSAAVSIASALTATVSAQSAPQTYLMEIAPRGSQNGLPAVLSCSEDSICELLIAGKPRPVTAIALFQRGDVFITLKATKIPLLIGQQMYGHVPLGISHVGLATFNVNQPTPAALEDAPAPLVSHPVIRVPLAFVATVDVGIRPGD